MDSKQKQIFTRRLSQCNSGEMIVIIYDIAFTYMSDADRAFAEGRHEDMKTEIRRAQRALDELIGSLDFSYDIAEKLYSLYVFCKNELSRAMYENKPDGLKSAEKILRRLYASFVEAAKQDTSAPLMENTQQVYAGMTYARGELNESCMDEDGHRGFFV